MAKRQQLPIKATECLTEPRWAADILLCLELVTRHSERRSHPEVQLFLLQIISLQSLVGEPHAHLYEHYQLVQASAHWPGSRWTFGSPSLAARALQSYWKGHKMDCLYLENKYSVIVKIFHMFKRLLLQVVPEKKQTTIEKCLESLSWIGLIA